MSHSDSTIREARADDGDGLRGFADYGPKIRTRYSVRLDSDSPTARWRRVYAMSYGNAASLYVIVGGQEVFIDETDLECILLSA